MKAESAAADQDKVVSPYAREIEYALTISHMINAVREDPSQMRATVYEFARARLKLDTSWAVDSERDQLSAALETAIKGVEEFSLRREERERLLPPPQPAQPAPRDPSLDQAPRPVRKPYYVGPAPDGVFVPRRGYWPSEVHPVLDTRTRSFVSTLARFCAAVALFGVATAFVLYKQRGGLELPSGLASVVAKPEMVRQVSPSPEPSKPTFTPSEGPPIPLPSDYGVYVLSGAGLSELSPLAEQVPDKRIAVSTPINEPSLTTLPDGKAKFVIFRRDLVRNAPDRMDVRVVARVVRAITFDPKGKPTFSPVSDAWNIRNQTFEFRVRPITGNPEMLLVQSTKPDLVLPAGRYVLALKGQGYDFTVGGKITDPSQCLERTDAANGSFYSECAKQ
jgi:hypothetical protein